MFEPKPFVGFKAPRPRARTARAGGRRSAGDSETPRAGRGRVSEGCSKSIPARGRDGPRIIRRRGGDGCGRPASAGGIVFRRYDGSGSDCLSGTISEGDSSSRLASINARRIFSITVISVFIAVRLSRVPAHCSSLLESPFERTVRCRAVFRMASYARFRWTASSVNVSRSMIMMCRSLARPGSETGAMIGAMPRPRTRPAPCRGAAHTGAPVPRAVPFTSRKLGALAARGPGAAGGVRRGR